MEGWRPVEDVAYGGTAAILREQAPSALDWHTGVDAMVVATDNAMTEDGA